MRALLAMLIAGCGASAPPPAETSNNELTPEERAHDECVAIMRRTRTCEDDYVPALLAIRVRHDNPAGIRARYEEEGEDELLPIAHEEFRRDWSEEGIAAHCGELIERPAEVRDRIVEEERECMVARTCTELTACIMDVLERRWQANAAAAED